MTYDLAKKLSMKYDLPIKYSGLWPLAWVDLGPEKKERKKEKKRKEKNLHTFLVILYPFSVSAVILVLVIPRVLCSAAPSLCAMKKLQPGLPVLN